MLKSKITPALAASALVVAVFGSTPLGHAAQNLVLAKNSVGTAQLKKSAVSAAKIRKDAVTSAKVKNGSLLAADFKAGQLPAGPQGPQGPQGLKGDTGLQGLKGDKGDQGESGLAFLGGNRIAPAPHTGAPGGSFTPVTLERASRLLVHGVLTASSFTCAAASPTPCTVQLVPVVSGKAHPTTGPSIVIAPGQAKGFAPETQLFAVTDEVPAGVHEVGIGMVGSGQFTFQYVAYGAKEILAVG